MKSWAFAPGWQSRHHLRFHAIHPNSRHLFGIRQHREFYSAQDFKTDQEPPLNSFYKHASKPHSIYPIRHLSFWVLNSVRCCQRSKRFPVDYRRGSPSDTAGNELNHMHESFLVEQPRAPSDYRWTYMYNAARAEPPSDAVWAFPVEWIHLTNALKSVRAFLAFTSFKSHAWRGSPCWHREPSLTTRASQQKTCLFHPAAGESHPSRLRAAISSQVTTSASWPPNFTFPSLPVRQWVLISHRTPARCSRPDNLIFSVFTGPTQQVWYLDGCRRGASG